MESRILLTEYPQLCEAETEASGRLPGTPVQRRATIAHGDGICATYLTAPSLVHLRNTAISTPPAQRQLSPEASPHDGNRAPRA
jgi:hypothetical protein